MSCYDASGVRSIKLYENIDTLISYDPVTGGAIAITTNGNTINIDSSLRPDYSNATTPGNYNLLNRHTIKWYNFDLVAGKGLLNQLRNILGWYAVITFNSGNKYIVDSPMFLVSGSTLTSSNTHTWEITLQNEIETTGELNQFIDGELGGIGYMEIENDFIVS